MTAAADAAATGAGAAADAAATGAGSWLEIAGGASVEMFRFFPLASAAAFETSGGMKIDASIIAMAVW